MTGEQKLRDAWEQRVRSDPQVTGPLLLVLLTAATYGDRDGGRIRVTEGTLARVTGSTARTVRRHLQAARQLGYLVRVQRGHRVGDGSSRPSQHCLALPAQPDNSALLSDTSTGQQRPVEAASTGQQERLNRTAETPQPDTGDRLPGSDQIETSSSSCALVAEQVTQQVVEQLRRAGHNVAGSGQQQLQQLLAARQLQEAAPAVAHLLRDFPPPAQVTAGSPWALLRHQLKAYTEPETQQARRTRELAERAAERERLATPPCEDHGGQGGQLPSGEPRCPACRRLAQPVAVGS